MAAGSEAETALVVMIGLPGAGKTFLARRCADELERRGHAACVLSLDDFVPLEDQVGGLKQSRGLLRRGIEVFLARSAVADDCSTQRVRQRLQEKLEDSFGRKKFVFVDDNNFYRSMRYEFFQLARKCGCGFGQIYVQCSVDEAVKRDSERKENCRVGREVVEKMALRLEAPSDQEEWEAERSVWVTSSGDMSVETVMDQVVEGCRFKVPPLPQIDTVERQQDRLVCSTNQIHAFDKLLRKFVGNYLLNPAGRDSGDSSLVTVAAKPANVPKQLAKCKKEILAEARSVGLPVEVLRVLDCSAELENCEVDEELERFLVEIFAEKLRRAGNVAINLAVP